MIEESVPVDDDVVDMENAMRLLLYMLVYQLMHIARCILHSAPDQELETMEASTQVPASVRDTQWSSLDVEGSTEACTLADEGGICPDLQGSSPHRFEKCYPIGCHDGRVHGSKERSPTRARDHVERICKITDASNHL